MKNGRIRIFYAADIHGSEVCFRKFLNAGEVYKADAIILGGDLTGKVIVPIVQLKDGSFETRILGRRHFGSNPEELASARRELGAVGLYAQTMRQVELEELRDDPARQRKLIARAMSDALTHWVELAEEKLAKSDIECYIMLGNDDDPALTNLLSRSSRIVNPDLRIVTVAGRYEMVSLGFSNKTPFDSPREMDEESLRNIIWKLASQLSDGDRVIFNFHCPPYGVGLDLAPALDEGLRIISYGGQPALVPVGSTAIYKSIERFQPIVSFHGHIHESRGIAKIGRTTCLNPGSEYGEGVLCGVVVDLLESQVKNYQFVAG